MIFKKILNQFKLLELKNFLFLISFFYLVISINSPFYFHLNLNSPIDIINFLRGISPIILLPIFIIYLIYYRHEIKFDTGYFLFFLYFLFQFLSYLIFDEGKIQDLYWLICGLSTISLFYIVRQNRKINILFLKFFLILLSIIAIKFLIDLYQEYISLYDIHGENFSFHIVNFYSFKSMGVKTQFFEQPVPRSSGLARILLILFLSLFVHYIYSKKIQLNKIINFILLFLLIFTIFHLQNRLALYFIFIFIFLFLSLKIYNTNLKSKLLILIFIFFLPYLSHLLENKIRMHIIKNIISTELNSEKNINNSKLKNLNSFFEDDANKKNLDELLQDQRIFATTSSGRYKIWKNSISLIKKNIFGYGPQADRNILDQNASNFYLYTLLCGGFFSFLSVLIFSFLIFYRLIRLVFFDKILIYKKKYLALSIIFISFFYFRTLTEITFGIFGIDMILFFTAYNIINTEKLSV